MPASRAACAGLLGAQSGNTQLGNTQPDNTGWRDSFDATTGSYRALWMQNESVLAYVFLSSGTGRPDLARLQRLFATDQLSPTEQAQLLANMPLAGRADPTICSCFAVGEQRIVSAIAQQKLRSTSDIGNALRAGTNCGSCLPELQALLPSTRGSRHAISTALS